MIYIGNLNKAKVLAALYNNSKPQGLGFFQFDPEPIDFSIDESTAKELNIKPGEYSGYSKVVDSGMIIYLVVPIPICGGTVPLDDVIVFISFSEIVKNKNAQNLVKQVYSDLFSK